MNDKLFRGLESIMESAQAAFRDAKSSAAKTLQDVPDSAPEKAMLTRMLAELDAAATKGDRAGIESLQARINAILANIKTQQCQ